MFLRYGFLEEIGNEEKKLNGLDFLCFHYLFIVNKMDITPS
ncbi:hypothetical protein [Bacillus cereus group sp. BfR-BA-01379]|nr:hypothetical protein [Bacillus cereus group sp. BfR-BA-01379]